MAVQEIKELKLYDETMDLPEYLERISCPKEILKNFTLVAEEKLILHSEQCNLGGPYDLTLLLTNYARVLMITKYEINDRTSYDYHNYDFWISDHDIKILLLCFQCTTPEIVKRTLQTIKKSVKKN